MKLHQVHSDYQEETLLDYGYPLLHERRDKKEIGLIKRTYKRKELRKIGAFTVISEDLLSGKGKYQLDFIVPDGSTVIASQDGEVIRVEDRHDMCGSRWDMDEYLNFVTIKHLANEFTQYCHLKPYSVRQHGVKVGSMVRTGQPIARVGKTGRFSHVLPHSFSFICFKVVENPINGYDYQSLKIRFIKPKRKWFWQK